MLAWWEGRLRFFEVVPAEAVVLLDTYYFSYFLCFLASFFLVRKLRQTGELRLPREELLDLSLWTILGILIGARLGYILFYNLEFYIQNPVQLLSWSGMASHGALIGGGLALFLFARRFGRDFFNLADAVALCIPFGALFIRAANFLNGELFGRSSSLPWSMRFPIFDGQGRALFIDSQDQIHAMQMSASGDVYLTLAERLPQRSFESFQSVQEILPQQIFSARLGSLDGEWVNVARLITDPSHPSQIYQLILSFFVLGTFLFWRRHQKRKFRQADGVLFVAFLAAYGLIRFVSEFFREPDPQRAEGLFAWLSLGQILSLLLLVAAAVFYRGLLKRPRA